jgi:hypothetical protein
MLVQENNSRRPHNIKLTSKSLSRVFKMVRRRALIGCLPQDSDLLTLISTLMIEIRRVIAMTWVKGHQDRIKAYDALSKDAQMNMSADFLATRYRLCGKLRPIQHINHPPFQRISLTLNGIRLTSQIDSCLRYHINGYHLRRHLQSKRRWADKIWDTLDFDLFGRHYQRLDANRQVFQTKFSYDQLPLGQMGLYRSRVTDPQVATCPCCKTSTEDMSHFLRCRQNSAFRQSLVDFRKDPKFPDDNPTRRILSDGIQHWIEKPTERFRPDLTSYPSLIIASTMGAIDSQTHIGWNNAIRGFLSQAWTDLASRSLSDPDTVDIQKGRARMQTIIQSLHKHSWDTWLARNDKLHKKGLEQQTSIRTAEKAEIRFFYENPTTLHFDD